MEPYSLARAAADKQIIDIFFDLLQTGLDLRKKEITCTSVEGADVGTGEAFVEWIKLGLKRAKLVILFVTPNYLNSSFCVAEMGAAWALDKPVFPLLAPAVDRDLGTVMLGRQTAVIDETGLNKLYDRVRTIYPDVDLDTHHWNSKMEMFLAHFKEQLLNAPKPQIVPQAKVDRVQSKLQAATQRNKEYADRIRELEGQVALLEKAKDPYEVTAIKRRFDSEQEQYESLTSEIGRLLRKLDPVEVRCLYASVTLSGWHPSRDTFETCRSQIERALQSERIFWVEDGPEELYANKAHPIYQKPLDKIRELKTFITEKASGNLIKQLEEEREVVLDTQNLGYWEDTLYRDRLLD